MSDDYDDDDHGGRGRRGGNTSTSRKNRHRPFVSVLVVGLFVVPAVIILFRIIIAVSPEVRWLTIWLTLFLFGVIGPLVAVAYGNKVAGRNPFVTGHVAATIEAFAVALSLGLTLGWTRGDREMILWRLLDAVTMPAWSIVVYLLCTMCLVMTWWLPRLDSFRAATSGNGKDGSGLEALIKWPKRAKVRGGTIEADEFAVEAIVDHPGVPISELRSKVAAIEENPNIVRGRSSITPDGQHGGRSKIRLVHTDPHSVWRVWPGLTHPGGSYSHPISTSYYSTGAKQWYSFVRTPEGLRSEAAPDFRSPNDTFKGSQGMTGAGKSGDAAIELAEIFSRTNVVVAYVDVAKLLQNAGWCLDFCELAAGSRPASRSLFKGLRRLGEYRSRVLGEAGHRNFTDRAYDELGLAWFHIFADEFDVASQGADVEWLATKGRSLGMRLSFTLPRAHGKALDTDIRGAIGMWTQFGISQDYDKAFALSKETMEAGAAPENFGASVPGAHYLDGAPGVDKNLYAIDCRTYQTREDYGDLRRAVEAARATFTPATLTPGELEVLGDVAEFCRPSVVRGARVGMDDDHEVHTPLPSAVLTTTPQAPDLQETMRLSDEADDGEDDDDMFRSGPLADAHDMAAPIDHTAILETLKELGIDETPDPEREIAQLPAGETGAKLVFTKPRAKTPEDSVREFDAALVRLAKRGVTRFTNKDVIEEMAVVPSESWISKRFRGLCDDGEHISPPGLTIERLEGVRGTYLLTYLAGEPVGVSTHSE
jgi:hypothetical protein